MKQLILIICLSIISIIILNTAYAQEVVLFADIREDVNCTLQSSPSAISFGDIHRNIDSDQKIVTISNTGNQNIKALQIVASDWTPFNDEPNSVLYSGATLVKILNHSSDRLNDLETIPLSSVLTEGSSTEIILQINIRNLQQNPDNFSYIGPITQKITINPICQ